MAKGRSTGLVLEFGGEPDDDENGHFADGDDDYPEEEPPRARSDANALIADCERTLQQLRALLADEG